MLLKLRFYLMIFVKNINVQLTINDKPCCKPIKWTLLKLGPWLIKIDRQRFKAEILGKWSINEHSI